jgi:DNA-binding LacI/PurR family transcriptional regulator
MSPPLTGFRAPSQQLAATAIAQLYRLHYEAGADAPRLGGSDHADLAFTGELIVRDSCRQIPTQQ